VTPLTASATVSALLREAAEPITDIDQEDIGSLLEHIGDSRVVLLGEATHGTAEFYRMRARITRELVRRHGFTIVAVEADWPDARQIDRYVRHLPASPPGWTPFARFPTWMWRNREVADFSEWLRSYNAGVANPDRRTGFFGLDLYSLYTSVAAVLDYLDEVDPSTAALARERYGCLTAWAPDPAVYGRAAVTGRYRTCEPQVIAMLQDAECAPGRQRRAVLPGHVLRLGGLLESARPAHVRDTGVFARVPRSRLARRRMGA
jgi:protein-L-isoaspartate(D-aspartate) O-methyltransferase